MFLTLWGGEPIVLADWGAGVAARWIPAFAGMTVVGLGARDVCVGEVLAFVEERFSGHC